MFFALRFKPYIELCLFIAYQKCLARIALQQKNDHHIGFWSLLRRTTTHRESPFFYVKIHKTLVPLNYTPFFSV